MTNDRSHFLIRFRFHIGFASVAVILLYFVYLAILRLNIISPLGVEQSFKVVSKIINFTFILAITTLILSIISYTLPKILPPRMLATLSPGEKATLVRRTIRSGFTLAITAILFGAVSYTLPKILPRSFFEPAPKIQYAVAIAKMFDPYEVDPIAQVLDEIEPYPGFPYYSRESDHPTVWPLRVTSDREKLFLQYEAFLARFPVDEILSASRGDESATDIQVLGEGFSPDERSKIETIAEFRSWFNTSIVTNPGKLVKQLGSEATGAFMDIEKYRRQIRQHFPNRFALARIKNAGKRNAQDVTIEFDLFGELYDIAIDSDPNQVRSVEYDLAKKRIVIERILPGSQVDIRLWYRYYSVENRVFPDKRDLILELYQGLMITNVAVSEGEAKFNKDLVDGFSAYECLYKGAAAKKDDYSKELAEYFKKHDAMMMEQLKEDEKEHPSFKDVSPEWLAASERADDTVNAIWVRFVSKAGNTYKAVHVFQHPEGPYILLSSTDKDREDFRKIEAALSQCYEGTPEGEITDRSDDICEVIYVENGFTQKNIAEKVSTFFRNTFDEVAIEAVHY